MQSHIGALRVPVMAAISVHRTAGSFQFGAQDAFRWNQGKSVGLAAAFDKHCEPIDALPYFEFGFLTLGSIC